MKSSTREAEAPATPPVATAAEREPSTSAEARSDADPITRVAYKTNVPRDKVQEILDLYVAYSKTEDSGRDIYKIALLASQKTGTPTEEVGSVILAYRGLYGNHAVPASGATGQEAPKG